MMRSTRAHATADYRVASWVTTLTIFAFPAVAQERADLADLIFEPVPLAAATGGSLDPSDSDAADRRALESSAEQRLSAIERLRRRESSAPALAEQLGLLAVEYQGLDRHRDALEVLDEAIAITRRLGGRDNLEQIPLQEQRIPSLLVLDDIREIDTTEELIYSVYARNFEPSDRQMYYATINLADWNTTAYYKENYGPDSQSLKRQRLVINRVQRCIRKPSATSDSEPASCEENAIFTGDIKDVFDQDINDDRLRKIDRLYADYQSALAERGNVQLDIVLDIAKRIARLAFITKQEMDFERDNPSIDPNYEGSREEAARNSRLRLDESYDSGVRALEYAIEAPSAVATFRPEALAAALLDLGDWHLAFGKAAAAGERYAGAYRVLLEAGFSLENIDLALASEVPVEIPVFATHLYTRRSVGLAADAALEYDGYVDVAFTVDRLGNAQDIGVLNRSSEDSSRIERLLERHIGSIKFRPALHEGELADTGRFEMRYFYSY